MAADETDQALRSWAESEGCTAIRLDDSTEFARVWVGCAVFALTLIVAVCVPYSWWVRRAGEDWRATSSEDLNLHNAEIGEAKLRRSMGGFWRRVGPSKCLGDTCSSFDTGDSWAPDLGAAKAHLRETSITDQRGHRYPVTVSVDKLSAIGGTGIELYFRMLRYLGCCYALLAVLTAPTAVFSLVGDFVPPSALPWGKVSIGNLGKLAHDGLLQRLRFVIIGCQVVGISVMFVFLFVFHFRWIRSQRLQDDLETVTCSDFAVEIDGLPRHLGEDHSRYHELLKQYLDSQLAQELPRDEQAPVMVGAENQLEWVEIKDQAFNHTSVYKKGRMTLQEARLIVQNNSDACAGYTFHRSNPEFIWVVKRGTARTPGEGWVSCIPEQRLPKASEAKLFEDGFADTPAALGSKDPGNGWARPGRGEGIGDEVAHLDFLQGAEPSDVRQGSLDDGWLVAALAALAEFPSAVHRIVQPRRLAADGKYTVRLYDYARKDVADVEVDDRLPKGKDDKPAFAQLSYEGEMWPCILEKAFAKLANSYENLESGSALFALGMLTWTEDLIAFQEQGMGKRSKWICLRASYSSANPCDPGNVLEPGVWPDESTPGTQGKDWSKVLDLMAKYDERDFIMMCESRRSSSFGIMPGRTYTVVRVLLDVAGSGLDMLLLRGPSEACGWQGDWSDLSDLWRKYPKVKHALKWKQCHDGLFWMQAKDFFAQFRTVLVCRCAAGEPNREKLGAQLGKEPARSVRELTLVRDCGGRLRTLRDLARLRLDRKVAEEKAHRTEAQKGFSCTSCLFGTPRKQLERLDKQINQMEDSVPKVPEDLESRPVVRAFAILNTAADAQTLINTHRLNDVWILRHCSRRARHFRNSTLRIREPPEPSSVIWENQDVRMLEHVVRLGLVLVASVLLILASFALIYWISGQGGGAQDTTEAEQSLNDPACNAVQSDGRGASRTATHCNVTSTSLALAAANYSKEVIDCHCASVGYSQALRDPALRKLCQDWILAAGKVTAKSVVSSIVVLLINMALRACLEALAEFERPMTVSARNRRKMEWVSIAQTINTGFVILLVNLHGFTIFNGPYPDFVRGWYATVGTPIFTNMLLNVFVPAISALIPAALTRLERSCCASRKRHQAELLRLYTDPPFNISARYAQLLTTVFVTSAFSAGLPVLNLLAAAYMFTSYWFDKVVLLRCSRHPPVYDSQMPSQASWLMFYAVALHCVMGVIMFGQPCTFPSEPAGFLTSVAQLPLLRRVLPDGVIDRATLQTTWPLTVVLLLLVLLRIAWAASFLIRHALSEELASPLLQRCGRSSKVVPVHKDQAHPQTWEEAAPAMVRPTSYAMEESLEFKELGPYLWSPGMGEPQADLTLAPHAPAPLEAVEEVPTPPMSPRTPTEPPHSTAHIGAAGAGEPNEADVQGEEEPTEAPPGAELPSEGRRACIGETTEVEVPQEVADLGAGERKKPAFMRSSTRWVASSSDSEESDEATAPGSGTAAASPHTPPGSPEALAGPPPGGAGKEDPPPAEVSADATSASPGAAAPGVPSAAAAATGPAAAPGEADVQEEEEEAPPGAELPSEVRRACIGATTEVEVPQEVAGPGERKKPAFMRSSTRWVTSSSDSEESDKATAPGSAAAAESPDAPDARAGVLPEGAGKEDSPPVEAASDAPGTSPDAAAPGLQLRPAPGEDAGAAAGPTATSGGAAATAEGPAGAAAGAPSAATGPAAAPGGQAVVAAPGTARRSVAGRLAAAAGAVAAALWGWRHRGKKATAPAGSSLPGQPTADVGGETASLLEGGLEPSMAADQAEAEQVEGHPEQAAQRREDTAAAAADGERPGAEDVPQ